MYQSERCNYNGQVQTEHNRVSFNTVVRHETNKYLCFYIVFRFIKNVNDQRSIDIGGSTEKYFEGTILPTNFFSNFMSLFLRRFGSID